MKKIFFGLLDAYPEYAKRLAQYTSNYYRADMQAITFSSADAVFDYLDAGNKKLHVLLADETLFTEGDAEALPSSVALVYLTDERDLARLYDRPALYRFQRASVIMQKIRGFDAQNSKSDGLFSDGQSARLAVFCGAGGHCGTTAAAIAFAAREAEQGENVVYLNLQQNADLRRYFPIAAGTIDELMRSIRTTGGNHDQQLVNMFNSCNELLRSDGDTRIKYYYPFSVPSEAMDTTAGELSVLLEAVSRICSVCVVDIDSYLCDSFLEIVGQASLLVTVASGAYADNEARLLRALDTINCGSSQFIRGQVGVLFTFVQQDVVLPENDFSFTLVKMPPVPQFTGVAGQNLIRYYNSQPYFAPLAGWKK